MFENARAATRRMLYAGVVEAVRLARIHNHLAPYFVERGEHEKLLAELRDRITSRSERISNLERAVHAAEKRAVLAEEKQWPSIRAPVSDGRIVYESGTHAIKPGEVCNVVLGAKFYEFPEGFPDLFDVAGGRHGIIEDLQAESIFISSGFELIAGFFGAQNIFPIMASSGGGISSEQLAFGKQMKYPRIHRGHPVTLQIKNVGTEPKACLVRLVGRPAKMEKSA